MRSAEGPRSLQEDSQLDVARLRGHTARTDPHAKRSARNEPLDSGRSRTDHGLSAIIPLPRLPALAELSLFGVFVSTLQQIVKGSLLLGPLFAFAIAQSPLTLFGFGPFFWALVLGIGVSLLLERDELSSLRAGVARR